MSSKEQLRQIRRLTLALFISGTLNILVLASFVFWHFYERPVTYLELTPFQKSKIAPIAVHPTNAKLLSKLKEKTFEELHAHLGKTHLVEDGFTERDLALGILVEFHDLDLERALGFDPALSQKRVLVFEDGKEKVVAYPNLTKEQFDRVLNFLKTEKWPFKARGLFYLLKQGNDDSSLAEAFYLTGEFTSVEAFFKSKTVLRQEILLMLIDGDWGDLAQVYEKQRSLPDFSDQNRQKLLLAYLQLGSKAASRILIKTDFELASKRLSDATVLQIVRLLDQNSEEALSYLGLIAGSLRGDAVRILAQERYKEISGHAWEPLLSRAVIPAKPQAIFTKKESVLPVKTEAPKMALNTVPRLKKTLLYIVQDGDSLWKISKRFKVPVEEIRSLNSLKDDTLKAGTPLKIPDKK